MAVMRFVILLNNMIFRSLIFWLSVLPLIVFIVVSAMYTLHASYYFLLGVVPFFVSSVMCYIATFRNKNLYWAEYGGFIVSVLFSVIYMKLYWDAKYSVDYVDAQADLAWVVIIPIHFLVYFLVCCFSVFFWYLGRRFFKL